MNTKNTIILALAGIIIYYLLFKQKEFDTTQYLSKIENLEQKVDSLHTKNKVLNYEVSRMESEIAMYTKEVDSLENRIVIIKKNTDEKLRNVNSLSISELQRFFAERYNGSDVKGTDSQISGEGSDNK